MIRVRSIQTHWWVLRTIDTLEPRPVFFSPQGSGLWQPAVNTFRCGKCRLVCVDLAGVDRADIEVEVEPRRLRIRGVRTAPEPPLRGEKEWQVIDLEIDSGPFARELVLPVEVNAGEVSAQQRDGLLWIEMPIANPI